MILQIAIKEFLQVTARAPARIAVAYAEYSHENVPTTAWQQVDVKTGSVGVECEKQAGMAISHCSNSDVLVPEGVSLCAQAT